MCSQSEQTPQRHKRQSMKRLLIIAFLSFLLLSGGLILSGLDDFVLPERQVDISFPHGSDMLQGTLLLPSGVSDPPVVLLVHGDAAQDRWSHEGYLPLVNALLDRGIGVFSWDKPGVGVSSGNWLAQTMRDRAGEASSALLVLRRQPGLENSRMGFLGFSQAGWVVPYAGQAGAADFAILVGAAINWRDQGMYYMRQRLQREGVAVTVAEQTVAEQVAAYDAVMTAESVARGCDAVCERAYFERRNAFSDARADIRMQRIPTMVLMGEEDLNVDTRQTLSVWRELLPATTQSCIRQIDGATHGLLRVELFNYQLSGQWPWWVKGLFMSLGARAYAPGAVDSIANWVLDTRC